MVLQIAAETNQVRADDLLTDRVRKLKERILTVPVKVGTERLKYLLEVYREDGGGSTAIKRAKVLDKVLSNMTISVDENLIVGNLTKDPVGCLPFPEESSHWMLEETKEEVHRTSLGKVSLSEEDRLLLKEAAEYFLDRSVYAKCLNAYRELHPEVDAVQAEECGVWSGFPARYSHAKGVKNHAKVLNIGLEGLIKEVEGALAKLPTDHEGWQKRKFLKAVIISLNAAVKFARRYAALARDMAKSETNPKRKKELERIAETCEWVPAKPARSFYEAIQSLWFITLVPWIESNNAAASFGTFSKYMYPFYKKDKEEGKINEDEAIELLEMLNLKQMSCLSFQSMADHRRRQAGGGFDIAIGGLTTDGRDATNELDYLILEAQRRVRTIQPSVVLLYHDKLSEEFLLKCIDLLKTGVGQPPFFNYDLAVAKALAHPGITLAEARDATILGCVETCVPSNTLFGNVEDFNAAKFVELALNNGKDPLSGVQIGPQTGNAEAFKSYDDLHEAVKKQAEYFVTRGCNLQRITQNVMADMEPRPFYSALFDGCIENGKDAWEGGAKYQRLGLVFTTVIDLANSLAAIKELVFEKKLITMRGLLDAQKIDFEGKEDLREMLLRAPKFGNDDEYADQIAREWYQIFWGLHQRGEPYPTQKSVLTPHATSMTRHFYYGSRTGALPTGRKARIPLTDATVSPMPGTDRSGPTAMIRSATQAIDNMNWGTSQLNMKLHPAALQNKEGVRALLALIKTFMDLGGWHIQFNYVSDKTLKDAQVHPENYRDLVVRVAGFSAFFVLLDKEVQDEIIKRTEQTKI